MYVLLPPLARSAWRSVKKANITAMGAMAAVSSRLLPACRPADVPQTSASSVGRPVGLDPITSAESSAIQRIRRESPGNGF